jgi:F0F1-type ATP synthase assembly protein I
VEHPRNNESKQPISSKSVLSSLSQTYRKLAPYLNIGYFFAVSVTLLTWLGYYLDKKWHTDPWLILCGAVLGIVLGFYNFFKTVFSLEKKDDEN